MVMEMVWFCDEVSNKRSVCDYSMEDEIMTTNGYVVMV